LIEGRGIVTVTITKLVSVPEQVVLEDTEVVNFSGGLTQPGAVYPQFIEH
jgi:hypothetical protein